MLLFYDFTISLENFIPISERRSSMQIGNTTITPLNKQEQLTLSCDSDNLSERDEAEAEVAFIQLITILIHIYKTSYLTSILITGK